MIGSQSPAIWIQPPTTASTARAPTGRAHREPRLAAPSGRVEVLAGERGRLAAEDEEEHPERVEAGQERADHPGHEEDLAVPAAGERRGEDRVLREEAGERRDAGERERADQERDYVLRQELPQPAHLAHVLLAERARG